MSRFNITVVELESALKKAKKWDKTTITMHRKQGSIGCEVAVSKTWNSKQHDITDVASW